MSDKPKQPKKYHGGEEVWVRARVFKALDDEIQVRIAEAGHCLVKGEHVRRWPHDADGKPIV